MALTKIEYFVDDVFVGERTSAPFNELSWQGSGPGTYILTAKLYDDGVLSYTTPPRTLIGTEFVLNGTPPVNTSWETGVEGWSSTGLWTRFSGSTGSSGTGPSSAQSGSFYYYIETSNGGSYAVSYLTSPIWGSGPDYRYLNFYSHLYGVTIEKLGVEVRNVTDGGVFTEVFSKTGNIGNSWVAEKVDLSAYYGKEIEIRFMGQKGNNFTGDIGVDNITFTSI